MGSFGRNPIESFDPNAPVVRNLQNTQAGFLESLLSNPTGWAQVFAQQNPGANTLTAGNDALTSLARNGGAAGNAMAQAMPAILGLLGSQAPQFENQFSELRNPFGDLGAINQAGLTIAAQLPLFDRNLQAANAQLNTLAPGRFSSALAAQGRDLNAQALQDFNLFANQALMEGLGLQNQQQAQALNFLTQARALQQQAADSVRNANLQALGLQQQGILGGLGALQGFGSLVGNTQLGAAQAAANSGLAQQQAFINPVLQLIQSGLGYAQPQELQAIVQPSNLQKVLGGVNAIANLVNSFTGGKGFGK